MQRHNKINCVHRDTIDIKLKNNLFDILYNYVLFLNLTKSTSAKAKIKALVSWQND